MAGAQLLRLPDELLVQIANYLDRVEPWALGSLSRTCRRFNGCCAGLVASRQQLDEKYRVIHDRNPFNVPDLLRRAAQDAMKEAWHVRRAEIWTHRTSMRMWCDLADFSCEQGRAAPFMLPDEGELDDGEDISGPGPGNAAQGFDPERELEMAKAHAARARGRELLQQDKPMYCSMLEKYGVEKRRIDDLLEKVLHGKDAMLQALLLSLCPNLNTIIYVQHAHLNPYHDGHPLHVLNMLIAQCCLDKTSGWLPGFQSLRKISLNSETNSRRKMRSSAHRGDFFCTKFEDVESLFALPQLKVLRLAGVGLRTYHRAVPQDSNHRLPTEPGTSSVEVLEIAKSDLLAEETHRIYSLPKRLRYVQSDDPFTPTLMRKLHGCPTSFSDNLERLTFRSTVGERLWVLANYPSLRRVEGLTADALVWVAREGKAPLWGPQEVFTLPVRDDCHGNFIMKEKTVVLEALELSLPPNVETLSIQVPVRRDKGLGFFNAFLRELLRNITGKAEDETHTGARFPYLRSVTFLLQDELLPDDFTWDATAIANLRAWNVEVSHTHIPPASEDAEYVDVDESDWEYCLEDRHYTDPRHEVDGYEGKIFGSSRT